MPRICRLAIAVVTISCVLGGRASAQQAESVAPVRKLRDGVAQLLPGQVWPGTALNRPEFLAADGRQLCAIDYGDVAVLCASWDAQDARRVGRLGQGPGEYVDARSVELLRGDILVHDGQLRRAVWYASDGAPRGQLMLRQHFAVLVPEFPTGFWAVPMFGAGLVVRLDATAKIVDEVARPVSLAAADPVAMQFSAARVDSLSILLASRTNGRLYLVRTRARQVLDVAGAAAQVTPVAVTERVRLPDGSSDVGYRPSKRATYTSLAVAVMGQRVLVLGGTGEPTPLRLIDVYDSKSLAYRCSFALPRTVHGMAVDPQGNLVVIHWTPEPQVVRYRLDLQNCG